MDIRWLTEEEVIIIHDQILKMDPIGVPGICADGSRSVDSVVNRIRTRYHYGEIDEDVLLIAANYGMAIAMGHAFNDANKRTAFTSMHSFLVMNGFVLEMNKDEILDLMESAVEKGHDSSHVADLLYQHLNKLTEK